MKSRLGSLAPAISILLLLSACTQENEKTELEKIGYIHAGFNRFTVEDERGNWHFDPNTLIVSGDSRELRVHIDKVVLNIIDEKEGKRAEDPRAVSFTGTIVFDCGRAAGSGFYQIRNGNMLYVDVDLAASKVSDETRPVADSGSRQIIPDQPPALIREYACQPAWKRWIADLF